MVAPPLYRNQPFWYQRGLTQIASRFSLTFSEGKPDNLFLLPSFNCQDLLPDGAFLNPVSGLHYVLHLFDSSEAALDIMASSGNVQFGSVKETVRLHDDRMTYIESRHVHLQNRVDHRIVIDAEFNDWVLNRSEEDWLVVQGLPRLSNDLSNHDWQKAAKKQVTELIKFVLNIDRSNLNFKVLLVLNPFRHIPTRPPLYNVRMDSVASSERIREIYSGFFRQERPMKLPASLKGVSVRNKITLNTKIRLAIMRELGSIYRDSNQGSSFKAQGHGSRPILITTPPRGSGRPRRYTFMQAVTSLKATFSDANLVKIFQNINDHHPGELQALFVIIRDDDRERIMDLVRADRSSGSRGRSGHGQGPSSAQGQGSGQASGANRSSMAPPSTTTGFVFGSGSGMDLEANFISSLRSPPPPPPRVSDQVGSPEPGEIRVSPERSKGSASNVKRSKRSRSRDSDRECSRGRSRERRSPARKSERSPSRDSSSPGRGLKRNHQSSSRERDVDLKKRKRTRRRSSTSPSSSESEKNRSKKSKKGKKSTKDKKHKRHRRRSSSSSSSGSRTSRSSKAESAAGKSSKSHGK